MAPEHFFICNIHCLAFAWVLGPIQDGSMLPVVMRPVSHLPMCALASANAWGRFPCFGGVTYIGLVFRLTWKHRQPLIFIRVLFQANVSRHGESSSKMDLINCQGTTHVETRAPRQWLVTVLL